MSTYVLVHGAWHGAWCWENIVPMLEKNGHTVYAVDLPSHGADKTPASQVSLKSYTNKVCSVIDEAKEPVILVGHSMGGIVVSQSAEYRPEKVKSIVYVTAFLLEDGQSMVDVIQTDTSSLVPPNMIISNDNVHCTVKDEALIEVFYEECPTPDAESSKSRLVVQPLEVLSTKLSLTKERFGRIPKYYIECLKDKAITNWCQKNMYTSTPCEEIFTLDTDHSPFYSASGELADILHSISLKKQELSNV
ncbi:alpha/beta hydrolase [Bacillus sp. M6-12]|uniref:alpha/beta fold hydrolase n=1 Tax=Bacillus sp. M6-12 TaxID=2054166 RepID=UPI000C762D50|nr:alpha/beta fold hydrolase [Bacillus sp. M6-12]PLS18616.1 alpha/beta hydrolase [Bacillus sp. M6-12]